MNPFNEDNLIEQPIIQLIKELWADPSCYINGYFDKDDAKLGRDHRGEVVLTKFLMQPFSRINKGRLGVFWHTQGSGKSYAMVYLSQKVFRKLKGNFTFVIVTDRTSLDRQAYRNFATVGAVYEKEVHAESIVHLKELLRVDHRQIFTTIQKFQDISGAFRWARV